MAATRQSLVNFLRTVYVPHRLGLSPVSAANYEIACRSYSRYLGRPATLRDLSEGSILAWLSKRLQEVAPKTVRRERGDVLTLWRFAAKKNLAAPVPDIPTIRVPRRVPVSWRLSEFEAIVASARTLTGEIRETGVSKAAWWSSLLIFLYWTGARIGAALKLQPADFDLKQRCVRLQAATSKTDVEQVLSLHDQVLAALAEHWCPHRERVWPWPYHPRQKWVVLKKILRKTGLPSDRYRAFHCFRRTNYTLTVKFGSREMASQQLGHSTDMSRHYLDTSQLPVRQAADVLPAPNIVRTCSRQLRLF